MLSCFWSQSSQCLVITADDGLSAAQLHPFHSAWWWWDPLLLCSTSTPPGSNSLCSTLCALWLVMSWSSESWLVLIPNFWFWSFALLSVHLHQSPFLALLMFLILTYMWQNHGAGVQTTLHTQKQTTGSSSTGKLSFFLHWFILALD